MHQIVAETGLAAPEQAQHVVRRPAAVMDPLAAELGEARNFEGVGRAVVHRLLDLCGQLRA